MHPHFLYISTGVSWLDPVDLPAYFSMVSVGFAVAILCLRRWGRRNGLDGALLIDLGLYMVVFGVLGGRVLHILADGQFMDYVNACVDPAKVDWDVSQARCTRLGGIWEAAREVCHPAEPNCLAFAQIWNGGFSFQGGLVAAAAFGVWFLKRHRVPLWPVVDASGWAIPLGLFFGRIGCFLGGCCFGATTSLPWGVAFPAHSPASSLHYKLGLIASRGQASLPVHPTQLYEAIFALAFSAFLLWVLTPRKRYHGQVFVWFVAGYCLFRFLVEFLRQDQRGLIGMVSSYQILSLALFGLAIWAGHRLRRAASCTPS